MIPERFGFHNRNPEREKGHDMTRLFADRGFRIWMWTCIAIAVLFIIPAATLAELFEKGGLETSEGVIRFGTVVFSFALAMLAGSRYGALAMKTANESAAYNTTQECKDDINLDNFALESLLVISWIFVTLGFTTMLVIAAMLYVFHIDVIITFTTYLPIDWAIGFVIVAWFNFKMTRLRRGERDLTIRNSLLSMERKPLAMMQNVNWATSNKIWKKKGESWVNRFLCEQDSLSPPNTPLGGENF